MSPQGKQPGFLDKNTMIAIALSFGVFFAWQAYMNKKYPPKPVTPPAAGSTVSPSENKAVTDAPAAQSLKNMAPEDLKLESLRYENENYSADISSLGMGFKRLELKKFTDRGDKPVIHETVTAPPLISTIVNDQKIFKLHKVSEHEFEGIIQNDQWNIKKTIKFDPDKYLAQVSISVAPAQKQKVKVISNINGKIDPISRSFMLPAYEYQEFYVATADKDARDMLDPEKAHTGDAENVRIASFNSQYFAMAMANRSELMPRSHVEAASAQGSVDLIYETPQPVDNQELKFDFYFGPKKMDILKSVDDDFKSLIDYGFFAFIARPLFWVLKTLHQFLSNWGVAIIMLTILLRLTLLPINIYSMRSMKRMQKLQPKLQALKEKYKGDPARMNQETLQLMRTEKANPLNGCLPALMQIPIFFALYQMLGKSFELYKQPFTLWIFDLSSKDPYFVLPILAGAMFFLQQKLTPVTSMDPAQQKILLFMPLVFTVFMLSVPSGLALYMFVNAAFGIFQQMAFMKEKTI